MEGALDAALNDTAGGLGAAAAVNGELDATAAFALVSGALARAGDANFFDAARLAVCFPASFFCRRRVSDDTDTGAERLGRRGALEGRG